MNKLITYAVILHLIIITVIRTTYAEAPQPEILYKDTWTKEEVMQLVDYYADKHELSRQVLHKVIKCESGYNYQAVNWQDSHKLSKGSHGAAQFSKETFLGFAKQMGTDYDNPYNANQALDVASWAIKHGYGNHWSCYK